MRVLMLSDVYFPRVNGVSTSIRSFRSVLAQIGVSSTLVAPGYPQHDGRGDEQEQVVRVAGHYLPFDPEDRLMRRRALRQQLRALQPESYDLIHIQTPFAAHYAGVALARRYGKPVLSTYHTLFAEYIHCYAPWLPSALGRKLAQGLSRRQCNAVDTVIAPSRIMHDTLRAYGIQSPIEVIPTGLPLAHEPAALTRPFAEQGIAVEHVFYFGESVLLHSYRGQGVGVRFFQEREAHARALGGYRWAAFCGVVRPLDHPRRPADFVPLDAFWRRRGYAPVPGLIGTIGWRDLDETEESAKPMQFWVKRLA